MLVISSPGRTSPPRHSLEGMSRATGDQPAGHIGPSPLFFRLLDRAFDRFVGASPTVLRTESESQMPTRRGQDGGEQDAPSWPIKDVSSTEELAGAATELLSRGPVLLFPSWARVEAGRNTVSRWAHEQVLMDCRPAGPDSLLAAVVPASTLISTDPSSEKVRAVIAVSWQPVLVLYLQGTQGVFAQLHRQAWVSVVFLRARQDGKTLPLRLFGYTPKDDGMAVAEDFDRLLVRNGGRGRFGYVLRDLPAPGDSLAFTLHDPALKARREALSGFGSAATVDAVFDTSASGYHDPADRALRCEADEPDAVRVIGGRDLKRDGAIGLPDEQAQWARVPLDRQLQIGDILLQAITSPYSIHGIVVVEVTDSDLPAAAASQSVAVLRPKPNLDAAQRVLTIPYLRSRLAHDLLFSTGAARISVAALRALPLPQPDEALSVAVTDLAEAMRSFEAWRAEAETVLQSAFPDNEAFAAARTRLVEHGRLSRLRQEAAANLDDQGYIVRTRFPYPVAYRWRTVEALRSAGATRDAYEAVLQTAEVLLCYTAQLALMLARDANRQIGYSKIIRSTFSSGRGLGFGDWAAVLEEVRSGKEFRNLPEAHPLNDLRALLAGPEASDARRRLNDRRNDGSHLRTVDPIDLPNAIDHAVADLTTLLQAASFLADLPLIHVTEVQWDDFCRQSTVSYWELAGDHAVAPTRTMQYDDSRIEKGSLYLVDSRHRLHLLRPFLIGSICPVCRNWSTFHVDGVEDDVVTLKSLEHGHTMKDTSLAETLQAVGLL